MNTKAFRNVGEALLGRRNVPSCFSFIITLTARVGLTIETVSSTNLIISIGLCVDCPAHIAHEFLAAQGKIVTIIPYCCRPNDLKLYNL
jgi:hypothetical protein